MNACQRLMSRFKAAQVAHDARGVTALEYAMIADLIALVALTGVTVLGTKINTVFGNARTTLPATK